jgi:hypothetical protein
MVGSMNRDSYELKGFSSSATATFVPETRGNPLEAFASLAAEGRPFNLWLTGELLEPLLERWSLEIRSRPEWGGAIARDFEEASDRACAAFLGIANATPAPSDQALLAATGVTANLQRTLALLGEFMLGDPAENRTAFCLSRFWCGLIDYPRSAGFFSMCVEETTAPEALRANRRDYGHLRNALRCSIREIEPRCADGLKTLGEHVRRTGSLGPEDLRHLLCPSAASRQDPGAYENRSGVVRPRNSSM